MMIPHLRQYIEKIMPSYLGFIFQCLRRGIRQVKIEESNATLVEHCNGSNANKVVALAGWQDNTTTDCEFLLPVIDGGRWWLVSETTGRGYRAGTVVDCGYPVSADDLMSKTINTGYPMASLEEHRMRINELMTVICDTEIGELISIEFDGAFHNDKIDSERADRDPGEL
jgi:hypothetical protein